MQRAETAYLWSRDRSQLLPESLMAAQQAVYARIGALEATLADLRARLPSYTALKHNLGRPVSLLSKPWPFALYISSVATLSDRPLLGDFLMP